MGRPLLSGRRWHTRRIRITTAACTLALGLVVPSHRDPAPPAAPSPLDPLSRAEIGTVEEVLAREGKVRAETRFATLTLREPPKDSVRAALDGSQPAPRAASVVLYDWRTGVESRGIVDLRRRAIASWTDLPPADPSSLYLTVARATEIAQADPRVRAALARRGYTDLSHMRVEPEFAIAGARGSPTAMHTDYLLPQRGGDRVVRGGIFDRDALDGGDSRALGALTLWENLTRGRLDSVRDDAPAGTPGRAAPAGPAHPSAASDGDTTEPAHAFDIQGTQVRWGHWRLRVAVDPRRGLELYDIGFVDRGTVRSILYRASIAEMIAPYGDSAFGSWFPMDEGDVQLGIFGMTSAVPGQDAPADAVFRPAAFADDRGRVVEIPRAIAIFERATDVQWRHANAARRARELVVRGYCTADNYDYVFDWIFRPDGSIQVQVALTGVVNAYSVPEMHDAGSSDTAPIFRHLVAPGIAAPLHQHFFSYRLDFDIDRPDHNRVLEVQASGLPAGPGNERGEWFAAHTRTLRAEQDALQDSGTTAWHQWRVISLRDTNALGQPTGYALLPAARTLAYPLPTSAPRRRAGFIAHELWVTPYSPDEMYAAGDVPTHDTASRGLPQWAAANRPIDDGDVVLWYTLGLTHLPRTEDWPVMPTYTIGFRLVPAGFFSQDPAADAPSAPTPHASAGAR